MTIFHVTDQAKNLRSNEVGLIISLSFFGTENCSLAQSFVCEHSTKSIARAILRKTDFKFKQSNMPEIGI